MWNDLQNEFYMTADISENSIWKWSDRFEMFDEVWIFGLVEEPCELTPLDPALEGMV